MRRFLVAGAAVLSLMTAAQAETKWVGNAFITAVTPACGTSARVGDYYRAIYRPAAGVGLGNGANSYLSLTSARSNVGMMVPNNTFRPLVNYLSRTVGSTVNLGSHSGGILAWTQSNDFAGVPLDSAVTTTLAKFFGTTGCNATLQIYFNRLP
jgi:hypothetical protein